jgi:hypothetical protein
MKIIPQKDSSVEMSFYAPDAREKEDGIVVVLGIDGNQDEPGEPRVRLTAVDLLAIRETIDKFLYS